MTKILRARVRTTLLMGTLVLLAAPAYAADMPHFTLVGTATAASGLPSPCRCLSPLISGHSEGQAVAMGGLAAPAALG